jgi:hypothetical protein
MFLQLFWGSFEAAVKTPPTGILFFLLSVFGKKIPASSKIFHYSQQKKLQFMMLCGYVLRLIHSCYYSRLRQPVLQGRWAVSFVERHLGTDQLPKSDVIDYLRQNADESFLRRWKLTGTSKNIRKNRNCLQLVAAYKVSSAILLLFTTVHVKVCCPPYENQRMRRL